MPLNLPVLLAKIASARSDLMWSVTGLDEAALTSPSADATRTLKDILAHIAAWEMWTTDQLRLVAAGKSADLPRADVEGDNRRILAQRRDWPLCRVLAELTNSHAALMYGVHQWTHHSLDARYPAPWGSVRPARWLEKSAEHDIRHAAEITAWRLATGRSDHGAGPGCVLLAAMQSTRDDLLAWAGLITHEHRSVCGTWNVRDVLGHVADWEFYIARALGQMAAGQLGGEPYGVLDTWNADHVSARQVQTLKQVTADLNAARAAVLAALEPLSDAALSAHVPSRWNADDTVYGMAHACPDHDRLHARDLREAFYQI